MKRFFLAAVLTLITTQSFALTAARSPLERVLYDASGLQMRPGQVGGPSAKIQCPCSCQCPNKIGADKKCPTECLLGIKDGTSTPKGL